jgi:hypothetical protein
MAQEYENYLTEYMIMLHTMIWEIQIEERSSLGRSWEVKRFLTPGDAGLVVHQQIQVSSVIFAKFLADNGNQNLAKDKIVHDIF